MIKKIVSLIIILTFMVGCNKKEIADLSSQNILDNILKEVTFKNAITEDLKEQSIAERYGIAPNDIQNGIIYYTSNEDKSDKIIIAKAIEKDKLEKIERAFTAEIVGITDAWTGSKSESKKIDNHITKTKDLYTIVCISDEAKKIIEIFDNCLEK